MNKGNGKMSFVVRRGSKATVMASRPLLRRLVDVSALSSSLDVDEASMRIFCDFAKKEPSFCESLKSSMLLVLNGVDA